MISTELKNKWKIKIKTILEAQDTGIIKLNDWELGFIDSVDITLSENKELSFKQSSCLSKIYNRI